ncbi:MAG: EAL domain-containing protein [Clostridiales bacterium]|nr:EAL domain-containing protein [Clostridiales bacterium]
MYSILIAALGKGVSILLTILVPLLAAGAGVFLFFRIRRERGLYIDGKLKSDTLNKESFDEFLKKRLASANKNTRFTVFYIEINDARPIIEAFGEKQYHGAVGSLQDRFYKIFPKGSRICTYDDDSIMIYLEQDLDKKDLSDLSAFCLMEGHKPINMLLRLKLEFDLNIGVCSYNSFSADYDTFKQNLEVALAASKRKGLNHFAIYSSDLIGSDSEEYKYYQEIKQAIADKEFTLYYQPIFDLQLNKTIAYEVLLRWNQKTMGVLPPAKFLSIMEQSGDINWVGVWAFEQMLATYNRHKTTNDGIFFTMNLSPKQLMNPRLVDDFRRILKKYKVNANEVCLEIVEFAMFDKIPQVAENIERLTQAGFKMAIDDFSLETSSFKMLDDLNVSFVKLNKSFVEQSQDDFLIGGVVDTLVGYAEKENFQIVASMVEDDVTVEFLKDHKIHCGQGYFFGKPLPPEDYGL